MCAQNKKVLERGYDAAQMHGAGRQRSAAWWKGLGDALLAEGYVAEKRQDLLRLITVGPRGQKLLEGARHGRTPPVLLAVSAEMEQEEKGVGPTTPPLPDGGGLNAMQAQLKQQGFGEVRNWGGC